jgi:hypothetical protein
VNSRLPNQDTPEIDFVRKTQAFPLRENRRTGRRTCLKSPMQLAASLLAANLKTRRPHVSQRAAPNSPRIELF